MVAKYQMTNNRNLAQKWRYVHFKLVENFSSFWIWGDM